jgi:hypothetical protein
MREETGLSEIMLITTSNALIDKLFADLSLFEYFENII